jgi:hypothetical protein
VRALPVLLLLLLLLLPRRPAAAPAAAVVAGLHGAVWRPLRAAACLHLLRRLLVGG